MSRMAICSDGVGEYVPRVFNEYRLESFFDLVTYRGKSDIVKSRLVRRILDRFEDRPAIMIGDRSDDIEAARLNRIFSIAAAYGYGSEQELVLADATAFVPSDLTRLVPVFMKDRHS